MRAPKSGAKSGGVTHGAVDFLHAAAAASPHGLMVEQAGQVKYANAAYARILGYASPEDILGCAVAALPSADHDGPDVNGGPKWQTLRLEFGEPAEQMALQVVRDVSETHRLERRLRESEKMEALGRLVGGVAHDFNNILTAITLYSDLLRDRAGACGSREIEEIREAAQRGAGMVRQLLTFARQQPSSPRTVLLRQVIGGMSSVLEPLIGEDIELTTHFSAEADSVRADPSQLQQVILNLVVNARDAMPGGGRIRIETAACHIDARGAAKHPGLRPGPHVSLVISDTGCGMDEQVRTRVFEPFFTTKADGAGTGLGMAMVYGIVTQAGGTITVQSKLHKGTRVTVLLPQARAGEVHAASARREAKTRYGAETVLLVEDDAAVRGSIAQLLAANGYQVIEARDGTQAVRLARTHAEPIELLLSDMVMPRMNGAEAARQIRGFHPEAKVLFVSGYPAKAHAAAPDDPVLYKPFSRAVLARKVREVLDQRPAGNGGRHLPAKGTL